MTTEEVSLQQLISKFSQKNLSTPDAPTNIAAELQQIIERFTQEETKIEEKQNLLEKEKAEQEKILEQRKKETEEREEKWKKEQAEREEKWIKEQEEREAKWRGEQDQKEKEMRALWEAQHLQRALDLRQQEFEYNEKYQKWEQIEKQMEENVAEYGEIVHLNVGGKRFSIPTKQLLKHKGTYFEQMLTSNHSSLTNSEIFIDADREVFKHIFQYLKTGEVNFLQQFSLQKRLEKDFAFFRLPLPTLSSLFVPRVSEGMLAFHFQQVFNAWLPNKTFTLRYKASVDGFAAADFHRHCDNRSPTLSVIRTQKGYIFGGYSVVPWCSARGFSHDPSCFIFTLRNPLSIPPTKFVLNEASHRAVWNSSSDCMSFGNGDIHITSNSNGSLSSYSQFPYSYVDTTGKGGAIFSNEGNGIYFKTDELEVYSVHDTVLQTASEALPSTLSTPTPPSIVTVPPPVASSSSPRSPTPSSPKAPPVGSPLQSHPSTPAILQ